MSITKSNTISMIIKAIAGVLITLLVCFVYISPHVARAAVTEYQGIPEVYIEAPSLSDWVDKQDERKAKLTYVSEDLSFVTYIKIKPQGTSSLAYDKKNFTITCFEDEDYTQKQGIDMLRGWGEESKYCLKANYVDPSQAANVVAARLAGEMQRMYGCFDGAPNNGCIDGFPIVVYLNEEFNGLYTWNIPKADWMFAMDSDNPNHIVMCAETTLNVKGMFTQLSNEDDWSVEVGPENGTAYSKLDRLIEFIMDSTDEEFVEHFGEYLDLDSCLNYYCYALCSAAEDNWGKNMLIATYDGLVWYPSLYDLDATWGARWTGVDMTPSDLALNDYQCKENLLFERMEKLYADEIHERYCELRETVLSNNHVINSFEEFINQIPTELYERDKEKWPETAAFKRGYEEYLVFIPARFKYCDEWMHYDNTAKEESEEIGAELIYEMEEPFEGDGTQAYIDTEVHLYDGSMNDWILMACISNEMGIGDNVLFSCFSEKEPYRGLLLRNPTQQAYEFICGTAGQMWSYKEEATYFTVAIQREGDLYRIFSNGTILYELESKPVDLYDGSLLIGCEADENGKPFRFGDVTIDGLRVYQGTQSPSITAKQMEELLEKKISEPTEIKETVLQKRNEEDDRTMFETIIDTAQENGRVLLILLVGLIIGCSVVHIMDKKRREK